MIPFATCGLILGAGILTSYTDISRRKIHNHHLLVIGAAGLIVCALAILMERSSCALPFTSLAFGVLIAVAMYHQKLWRAGDAKLFALYAFLMPPTGNENLIFLPCLSLFACTFLAGLIWLLPQLLVSEIRQVDDVWHEIFCLKTIEQFLPSLATTLSVTWIFGPLLAKTAVIHYPLLTAVLLYFLCTLATRYVEMLYKKPALGILVVLGGLGLRLALSPQFFAANSLIRYVASVILYALVFHAIRALILFSKNLENRVPFAPLLFAGVLLSYTPFLRQAMSILSQWGR